jgi:hypothetical protein
MLDTFGRAPSAQKRVDGRTDMTGNQFGSPSLLRRFNREFDPNGTEGAFQFAQDSDPRLSTDLWIRID